MFDFLDFLSGIVVAVIAEVIYKEYKTKEMEKNVEQSVKFGR